ncbi:GSCOCG00007012001-RA-CDS [Cotesia congregata]|uniref:Similar to spopl: Speckle-type POZ protein-like (Xenopus laevis) n=1 Tax=Cotesia congregata TaxID=51543 RepID=A0A8J2H7W9_COTCN|nr:GSCOCG00007012001-RA-CDS [Cotesia congregata]CAG5082373.1 Similar to spopl: Speckle-type POZ protein-like (Xenopus laevis) [Cotesia congregata]
MPLQKSNQPILKKIETWVVNNVDQYNFIDESVKDSVLTYDIHSGLDGTEKWVVKLIFYHKPKFVVRIGAVFKPVNEDEIKHHVEVTMYVLTSQNFYQPLDREIHRTDTGLINGVKIHTVLSNESIRKRLLKKKIEAPETIINNTITLRIELITYLDPEPMFLLNSLFRFMADVQQPDWILKLYETRNVSGDLTIKIQDNEFRAHKQVLDQRGFALNNATTNENNIFILSGISPEIFGMLLEFVYTGAIKKLDDFAEPLLEAADRFKLEDLKNLCEKSLLTENYVNYNNFADAYVLAKRCNARQLYGYARYMESVLSNIDCQRWSKNNPPTAEQLEKYLLPIKKIREAEKTSKSSTANPSDPVDVLNNSGSNFSTNDSNTTATAMSAFLIKIS